MTHETRIALLVGLVFIVLFGLVLGQRSISFSKSYNSLQSAKPDLLSASLPGPEVVSSVFCERSDRPVLAPPADSPRQLAPLSEQRRDEPGDSAPAAPEIQPVQPVRAVSPPMLRTYRVRSGDTLIGIARKVYGRRREGDHLRIYRANRDKLPSPAALSIGQVLVIPPPSSEASQPRRVAAVMPPQQKRYTEMTLTALGRRFNDSRIYVVSSGDSLTAIARRMMGSGSRSAVRKLLNANRDRLSDPNRLAVGMRLRIPG